MVGGGCCSDDDLIAALESGMGTIAAALREINATLLKKQQETCKDIDSCMDKIAEALEKRWKKATASCDQCKQMLAAGMGGTIEFALQCAGACTKGFPDNSCAQADDGTQCSSCGQANCVCQDEQCKPGTPGPPKTPNTYYGWCDFAGGIAGVTDSPVRPFSPGATMVATGDNEAVVFAEALNTCKTYQGKIPPIKFPDPKPKVNRSDPRCSIATYATPAFAASVVQGSDQLFQQMSDAQFVNSIGRLGFDGINIGNIGEVLTSALGSVAMFPPVMASTFGPAIATFLSAGDANFASGLQVVAALGQFEKATGADLTPFMTSIEYAMNASLRRKFIDPDSSIMAYLADGMTYESCDTHWAIRGLCNDDLNATIQASKSKPIPQQLSLLRLREIISPSEYQIGMRQIGYLESAVSEQLYKLTEQLPTMSEIIRFMVRDADDEGIVSKFGLDDFFNEKYADQLKKWAKHQGVPELAAKYNWRSHWQIPSPTQLFEFWRRLRDQPQFGGDAKLWEDIGDAFVQQDILPYWHEHYKAIAYQPLGRVDIRRMYQIGALSDDELIPAIKQLGYSDENAEKLAKFTKQLRRNSAPAHPAIKRWLKLAINRNDAFADMSADGLPDRIISEALDRAEIGFASSPFAAAFVRGDLPRQAMIANLASYGVSGAGQQKVSDVLAVKVASHPAEREYITGTISRDEARQQMTDYGINADVIERMLRVADQAVEQTFVVNCQRAIKRRFLLGEIDKIEAINALTSSGTDGIRAGNMVNRWQCEQSARGKEVSAAKLCEWLGRGVINSIEFTNRLRRLGFSADDSARLLNDCLTSTNAKLLAQAKKDAKEQAQSDQRAASLIAKANAAILRNQGQLQKAQNQRKATESRREKQIMHVAEKISQLCECGLFPALQEARSQQARLRQDFGLSVDEALQTLTVAAENWEGGDLNTFGAHVDALASLSSGSELSPEIDPSTGVVITSG